MTGSVCVFGLPNSIKLQHPPPASRYSTPFESHASRVQIGSTASSSGQRSKGLMFAQSTCKLRTWPEGETSACWIKGPGKYTCILRQAGWSGYLRVLVQQGIPITYESSYNQERFLASSHKKLYLRSGGRPQLQRRINLTSKQSMSTSSSDGRVVSTPGLSKTKSCQLQNINYDYRTGLSMLIHFITGTRFDDGGWRTIELAKQLPCFDLSTSQPRINASLAWLWTPGNTENLVL